MTRIATSWPEQALFSQYVHLSNIRSRSPVLKLLTQTACRVVLAGDSHHRGRGCFRRSSASHSAFVNSRQGLRENARPTDAPYCPLMFTGAAP